MKKFLSLLLCALLFFALCIPGAAAADTADKYDWNTSADYYSRFKDDNITIDVYNWGDYISDGSDNDVNVNQLFTELTGIKVRYTNFASNEEMYAKIKSGGASYDVIIPSDYMVARMIDEGLIQKLDYSNIPNYADIDPQYCGLEFDPNDEYSVPYMWGMVGLIYNTTMVYEAPTSWDALWDEQYMNNMLMFGNSRDAFGIALLRLGYSLNTTDEEELAEAAESLKEQKVLVQAYVMDEIFNKMEGGEAAIAPYYAGDAILMISENPDLAFVYPEEGTNFFVDSMVVPTSSQHKQAAEMYINFMCETVVGYDNCQYIGYSTPLMSVYDILEQNGEIDPIAYPDAETIANTEVFKHLPGETNALIDSYWTEILSYNENGNRWIAPLFLAAMFAASVFIIFYRARKRRRERLLNE